MTQMNALRTMTVNHVVEQWPETMSAFRRFGVDMCCGGGKTVDQATGDAGADVDALSDALMEAVHGGPGDPGPAL